MEQYGGFKEKRKDKLDFKLKKSLHEIRSELRHWYKKFDLFMINNGYK